MTKIARSKVKRSRSYQVNIHGLPKVSKVLADNDKLPGMHAKNSRFKKKSLYAQVRLNQKLFKAYYNISNKHLENIVQKSRKKEDSITYLQNSLEYKFSTILFRSGLVYSPFEIKQLKRVFVLNNKFSIYSMGQVVKPGDVIHLKESKINTYSKRMIDNYNKFKNERTNMNNFSIEINKETKEIKINILKGNNKNIKYPFFVDINKVMNFYK